MPAPPTSTTPVGDRNWAGQVFLVFFPGAVGCLLAGLILDPRAAAGRFLAAYATVALAMALMAVIAPVAYIKKPLRAYRMLQGVGRSPLSRQAALVVLFLVLTIVVWALALGDVAALWLDILTVVVGFAAVLAAGFTYVLGSQPRWRHWSSVVGFVATVFALGVSLGLVVALGWRDELLGGSDGQIAGVVLALVGMGWLMSTVLAWKPRVALLPLVSVALVTAALSLLSPWLAIVAVSALLVALFAWRSAFFGAASVNSWRREVHWFRPQTEGRKA